MSEERGREVGEERGERAAERGEKRGEKGGERKRETRWQGWIKTGTGSSSSKREEKHIKIHLTIFKPKSFAGNSSTLSFENRLF